MNEYSRHQYGLVTDSEVEVSLDFTRNDTGKPFIKGRIHGEVSLLCQRCLEHLPYSLDCSVAVVLVQTDTEAEQIQEGYDTWLLEDERIFLPDFIEDELMLALPLVAAHTHCEPARPFIEGREEDEVADEESSSIANPFAALKNLKNQ